jgi:hypothetical protein
MRPLGLLPVAMLACGARTPLPLDAPVDAGVDVPAIEAAVDAPPDAPPVYCSPQGQVDAAWFGIMTCKPGQCCASCEGVAGDVCCDPGEYCQ